MLERPIVLAHKVYCPIAILWLPVVLEHKARRPIAVFSDPDVLVHKAWYPIAVLKFPIEFDFIDDPDRLSAELQVKIDEIIQKFIKSYIPEEKVITLTGTVEERLEQISKYL